VVEEEVGQQLVELECRLFSPFPSLFSAYIGVILRAVWI